MAADGSATAIGGGAMASAGSGADAAFPGGWLFSGEISGALFNSTTSLSTLTDSGTLTG